MKKLADLPPLLKILIPALAVLVLAGIVLAFLGVVWALGVLVSAVLIAILWLALSALVKLLKKRRADEFDRQLAGSQISQAEIDRARKDLVDRWRTAMKALQQARLSIYDLPWFLLIGEPQSGKSTTLVYSGIEFPMGKEALSGAGGTRNCDWWFANDAVILDTAGRFTFQERNAPDKEEWLTFLQLLRRHRATCPINGVLVVIPVTSLQEDSPEVLEEKANNIRAKLDNVQKILEIQFPVFVLVTKADHILGFTEFCGRLAVDDQRQLFGWSETRPFEEPYNPAGFRDEFEKVVRRLHGWRLRFLSQETSASEADKLFAFPEEFRALGAPLEDYLRIIFQPSRYAKQPFFRGYYVTSGMQQGRPIAKACAAMLGAEGARSEAIESLERVFQKQRAFFIRDFYREKVFREQGLIYRTPEAIQRDRKLRLGTWIGGSVLAALSVAFLTWGVIRYNRTLDPVRSTIAHVQRVLAAQAAPNVAEALAAAHSVSQRIEDLKQTGAQAAFFRGRQNVVSDDLHRIHRTVFEKQVLAPILAQAGKDLGKVPPEGSPQAPFYFDALTNYIRLLAMSSLPEDERQKRLTGLDVTALVSYYAASQGQPGFAVPDVTAEYARFAEEGGTVPSVPGGSLDLATAVTVLESYWPVSVELAPYRALLADTTAIDKGYRRATGQAGIGVAFSYAAAKGDVNELAAKIGDAQAQVDAINRRGFLLSSPAALYEKLRAEIDDGTPARRDLAAKLGEQSQRVQAVVTQTLSTPLATFDFLVLLGSRAAGSPAGAPAPAAAKPAGVLDQIKKAATGAAKEAAGKALDALTGKQEKIAAFTPLLEDVAKAAGAVADFFKTIDGIDPEIQKAVTQVTSGRPDDQAKALRAHADAVKAKADEIAKGVTVRDAADAPKEWSGKTLADKLPAILDTGYSQYLSIAYPHWIAVYKAYPLAGAPGDDSADWRAFRGLPAFLRGEGAYQIYEPTEKLVDSLLPALPAEMGTRVPGAKAFVDHLAWLQTNRKRVEGDATAFAACVWNLDDDPVKAWQMLHDADAKAVTSFANLETLTALAEDPAARFPDERVLHGLAGWSARAKDVLFAEVRNRLGADWTKMDGFFRKSLAGKFPFGADASSPKTAAKTLSWTIPDAPLSDVRRFFLEEDGIGGILTRYRLTLYLQQKKDLPDVLTGAQKDFVKTCDAWRTFLFKDDAERTQSIQVEYEPFLDQVAPAKSPLGQRFTKVRLTAPGGFDVTFRPSSEKARAKKTDWKPEAVGQDAALVARATNEDSGAETTAEFRGGSLSLLAYVTKLGTPERGRERRSWLVRIEVPDPAGAGNRVDAWVRFQFDQPVPETPKQ